MLNGQERHRLADIETRLAEQDPQLDELFNELGGRTPWTGRGVAWAVVAALAVLAAVFILADLALTGVFFAAVTGIAALLVRLHDRWGEDPRASGTS